MNKDSFFNESADVWQKMSILFDIPIDGIEYKTETYELRLLQISAEEVKLVEVFYKNSCALGYCEYEGIIENDIDSIVEEQMRITKAFQLPVLTAKDFVSWI